MRSVATILSGLALLGAGALYNPAWAARAPVVVELFTAQGCSSCGPANAAVAALAARDDVLPLIFSVDYWDYLGWKDTFAEAKFTDRQRAYEKHFGIREVFTPQVVLNGKVQGSGAKAGALDALLAAQAKARINSPDMQALSPTRIAVGSGRVPAGGAEVWLVRFDTKAQRLSVRRGDNRGQTLDYRNVVRELVRLGPWAGKPRAYRLPPAKEDGLSTAILVQGVRGGPLVGAMAIPAEKSEDSATR